MLIIMLAIAATQGPVTNQWPLLHYKVESQTVTDQDLTSIGRGKVTGSLTSRATVSVAMVDSAEGQVVRVKVDSMYLEPKGAMALQVPPATAAAAADSARGLWVRVFVARGAIRSSVRPSAGNPALASVIQAVGVLFPGLRTGLKIGDSWSDTTKVDNDVQGGHQKGSILSTWKVVAVENGGFVLEGTSASNVTTAFENGQQLTVNGSTTEHLVMAAKGPTHSATIESLVNSTTTPQAGGAPVLQKTTAMLRLTLIP